MSLPVSENYFTKNNLHCKLRFPNRFRFNYVIKNNNAIIFITNHALKNINQLIKKLKHKSVVNKNFF